jgi:4-amino-4-deoxy-L-arabinose transferase-like glycosyltransferase
MGIALLLRVLLPVVSTITVRNQGVFLFPDSRGYIKPAEELLRTGRFAIDGRPEIMRTPGYPILLLPGILLGKPVLVTIALQVLLSLLTVWLVYGLTLRIFENETAAAAAALLYALEPLSILYTSLILTETLFASLITAFFFCLVDYYKRRQALGTLVLAALALSASVYVRPVSYYLPILVSLVLLPALLIRFKKVRYVLHAVVFLAVSMGLVAAWQVRNRVQTGYRGFSTISDLNLYLYQGASAQAKAEGLPFRDVQQRLRTFAGHPEHVTWTEAQRSAFMRAEGIRMILEHPRVYTLVHLGGVARILFDPGSVDYLKVFHSYPRMGGTLADIADRGLLPVVLGLVRGNPLVFWTQLVLFALLAAYYALSLLGLFRKSPADVWEKIALVAVMAYFVAVSGGPHGYSRFRHPAMPFLCVLAGFGLYSLAVRRQQ